MTNRTPYVLIVLDGWGHRDETDANAIAQGDTPNWDDLWQDHSHTLISGSGLDVGLPSGQMGNSEVGHMNLGAGRVVHQELTRIDEEIKDGSFYDNEVLGAAADKVAASGKTLHILGLLSPGGVHSHEKHVEAAVKLAFDRGVKRVLVHAFLDGRDVPPKSARPSLENMDAFIKARGNGGIASICGRYYAMDRDKRWERTELAYDLLTTGEAEFGASSAAEALAMAYDRDEMDEFVRPTTIDGGGAIEDSDAVLFMNFRADRARQITRAFVEDDFDGFERGHRPALADFITLTQYAADIPAACAYPPASMDNGLGELLAGLGKTQLRLAETEKYAHVTFFFSGGREEPFDGEDRILIPSPKVATYDLQPEMSAAEMTDELVGAIRSGDYDFIVCNYANGDMVGHTGDMEAAMKAVECVDTCLGRIREAIEAVGGHCLITADHGNVEKMSDDDTGQAHTAHTSELVPLVYIGNRNVEFVDGGALSDIAPTLLELMDIEPPIDMTGESLIRQPANAAVQ
ncbi:MAG: 2,3-bisphosphoglycerate-independent phosphoglycerate mutase [Gammaproteobacteria bacterium]|nr:2,3-bisphosphoglycerate-independent phosphoglycerate mutase [Gammaproteobacteria bacterium]